MGFSKETQDKLDMEVLPGIINEISYTFMQVLWVTIPTIQRYYLLWNKEFLLSLGMDSKNIIIEGVSLLIINMIKKIINSTLPSKVYKSWSMEGGLRQIHDLIWKILMVTTSHVKRNGNNLVDILTNEGGTIGERNLHSVWLDFHHDPLRSYYLDMDQHDTHPPRPHGGCSITTHQLKWSIRAHDILVGGLTTLGIPLSWTVIHTTSLMTKH